MRQWGRAQVAAEAALAVDPAHSKSQQRLATAHDGLRAQGQTAAAARNTTGGRKLPKAQRQGTMCAACHVRAAIPAQECECRAATFCSPACKSRGHERCEGPRMAPVHGTMKGDDIADFAAEMSTYIEAEMSTDEQQAELHEFEALTKAALATIPKEEGANQPEKLAKQGHPAAAFMCAMMAGQRISMTTGGNTPMMGSLPNLDASVQQTEQQAVEWYRIAAKGGCLPAMTMLGDRLFEGRGCKKNGRLAFDLWYEAGRRGVRFAKRRVAARRNILANEVEGNGRMLAQMADAGRLPRGTCLGLGGPNLGMLLLAASPAWCHSGSSPLLREGLASLFRCCEQHRITLRPSYGRRGTMGQATALANGGAKAEREAANLQFVLGSLPQRCDVTTAAAAARYDGKAARAAAMTPMNPSGFTIACIHMSSDDTDGTNCPACRTDAMGRLWASVRALYATSETEPLDQRGRVAVYMTEGGELKSETFKIYSKVEVLTVLAGLTAAAMASPASQGGGMLETRPVAHPLFMAQDPNLFWPVVSYFGSVREGLLAVKPGRMDAGTWFGRLDLGEEQPLPETTAAERGQFSHDDAGAAMLMCGAEDCRVLCAKKPLLCGRCELRGYCSEKCQRADWKQHKLECRHDEAAAAATSEKQKKEKGAGKKKKKKKK
jgi:hypothetical protein